MEPEAPATTPGDDLFAEIAGATMRHAMSGLAGLLISAGAISPDQTSQFVGIASGIGMWVAGLAWSYGQKWIKRHGRIG